MEPQDHPFCSVCGASLWTASSVSTRCGHTFHVRCLGPFLRANGCPVCGAAIDPTRLSLFDADAFADVQDMLARYPDNALEFDDEPQDRPPHV